MSRRVRGILIALVVMTIGLTGIWMGADDLLRLRADIAAGAASVVVAAGAVAAVLAGSGLVVILSMELIRPSVKGQNRLFGTGLVLVGAGLLAVPVFPLVMGEALPVQGYQRCPGRVVGYTLPASRWVLDPALCRPTPLVAL